MTVTNEPSPSVVAVISHDFSTLKTLPWRGWVEHGRLPTGHNPSEASILRNKATCLYHLQSGRYVITVPSTISGATSLFDARTELIKKHPSEKTPKHDLGPSRDVSHPTFEPCVPGGDLSMTVRKSTDYVEPVTDACGSPQWKPADPEDIKPFGSVHNEVPLLILNARKYQPQARNDEPSAGRRWRFRPLTTAVQDSYGIAQVKPSQLTRVCQNPSRQACFKAHSSSSHARLSERRGGCHRDCGGLNIADFGEAALV
ncbi:hypothetical protein Bbelb_205670 [Branchiostoma belcheri]|nr:hypothetical protein Bbelb_205670 [Branchiostoma belcheri]